MKKIIIMKAIKVNTIVMIKLYTIKYMRNIKIKNSINLEVRFVF
jgi:hypothetical protein